jgi:hypothetical protein
VDMYRASAVTRVGSSPPLPGRAPKGRPCRHGSHHTRIFPGMPGHVQDQELPPQAGRFTLTQAQARPTDQRAACSRRHSEDVQRLSLAQHRPG